MLSLFRQRREPSSSSNQQSNISSKEHLKILLRIPFTIASLPLTTVRRLRILQPLAVNSTNLITFNPVVCLLINHQYCKYHWMIKSAFLVTYTFVTKNADKVCYWHLFFTSQISPASSTKTGDTSRRVYYPTSSWRIVEILCITLNTTAVISLFLERISESWVLR